MTESKYNWTGEAEDYVGDTGRGLPSPTGDSPPNAPEQIRKLAENIHQNLWIDADNDDLTGLPTTGQPLSFFGSGRPDTGYPELANVTTGSTFTCTEPNTTGANGNYGAQKWIKQDAWEVTLGRISTNKNWGAIPGATEIAKYNNAYFLRTADFVSIRGSFQPAKQHIGINGTKNMGVTMFGTVPEWLEIGYPTGHCNPYWNSNYTGASQVNAGLWIITGSTYCNVGGGPFNTASGVNSWAITGIPNKRHAWPTESTLTAIGAPTGAVRSIEEIEKQLRAEIEAIENDPDHEHYEKLNDLKAEIESIQEENNG